MKWLHLAGFICVFFLSTANSSPLFESQLRGFEKKDRYTPIPTDAVLVIGSSSIAQWKTMPQDLQPLLIVRRGFGGAQLVNFVTYFERIVQPYQPDKIVLYAGENDIAAGRMPQQALSDFQQFVTKVHTVFPQAHIYFLSIKPSLKRAHLWQTMQQTNQLIQDYTEQQDLVTFIDMRQNMYDDAGKLDTLLFLPDGQHLNRKGYQMWTKKIRQILLTE